MCASSHHFHLCARVRSAWLSHNSDVLRSVLFNTHRKRDCKLNLKVVCFVEVERNKKKRQQRNLKSLCAVVRTTTTTTTSATATTTTNESHRCCPVLSFGCCCCRCRCHPKQKKRMVNEQQECVRERKIGEREERERKKANENLKCDATIMTTTVVVVVMTTKWNGKGAVDDAALILLFALPLFV